MKKLDPWRRDPRGSEIIYWLAEGMEWAEVENAEDTFQKEWPDLHMWCALLLPQTRYGVYRWYRNRTGLNFVLVIRDTCNDKLFQSAWEDHVHEEA